MRLHASEVKKQFRFGGTCAPHDKRKGSRWRSVAEAYSSTDIPHTRPCSNRVVEPVSFRDCGSIGLSSFRSRPSFPVVLLFFVDEILLSGLRSLAASLVSSTLGFSELACCLYNTVWWSTFASNCLTSLFRPMFGAH